VRSERVAVPRPLVIRLTKFVHVPRKFRRQVTNTFLFARDEYRCQYCGRRGVELKPRETLTRDHLIPLSRGAAACRSCNLRKRDRTPEEAGMRLATVPRSPRDLAWIAMSVARVPEAWKQYLSLAAAS